MRKYIGYIARNNFHAPLLLDFNLYCNDSFNNGEVICSLLPLRRDTRRLQLRLCQQVSLDTMPSEAIMFLQLIFHETQ